MFDVITKREYWGWLDAGTAKPSISALKQIQDTYILSHLSKMSGKKILEIGGGDSRVIRHLEQKNECWMIDKFDGKHGGPKGIPSYNSVKIINGYMGEFSDNIPDNYFDVVFSISVVEHIPKSHLIAAFLDMARVLKTGATTIHAIDVYLHDAPADNDFYRYQQDRILTYGSLQSVNSKDLAWVAPPAIKQNLHASARHAVNGVDVLYGWNKSAPTLAAHRAETISASLKLELRKK